MLLGSLHWVLKSRFGQARQVLIKCLTSQAVEDARKARNRLHENSLRLATVIYERYGWHPSTPELAPRPVSR